MTIIDHFVKISKYFHKLILEDCHYTVSDTDKFIVSLPGKTLKMAIKEGDPIREGSLTGMAIKSRQRIVQNGNKDLYGIAHTAVCTPIIENGSVVGCISIGYSQEKNEKIANMAETLAAMIEEITAGAQSVAASSQELNAINENLFSMSDQMREEMKSISNLADLVTKIARDTNIIGLNASIQSAHAGEYGKGFSIVANEIRKMADRSSESSKTIKDQLLKIQQSVDVMLEKIESSHTSTVTQMESSEQISASIEELNAMAQELSQLSKLD